MIWSVSLTVNIKAQHAACLLQQFARSFVPNLSFAKILMFAFKNSFDKLVSLTIQPNWLLDNQSTKQNSTKPA